ncbi:MAG: hypothetical protein AAF804_16645, partial [Bacteroidota bacterium]
FDQDLTGYLGAKNGGRMGRETLELIYLSFHHRELIIFSTKPDLDWRKLYILLIVPLCTLALIFT